MPLLAFGVDSPSGSIPLRTVLKVRKLDTYESAVQKLQT